MGFRCGIVGLPNVGKSTLFNAVTASNALAANYPFATVEPNIGRVAVPDRRLDQLVTLIKPQGVVPAYLDIVDIAGLVRGASEGEGLGNKFLQNIREVDAILHVVRCFDGDVTHVEGRVDPLSDVELIDIELILADQQSVEQQVQRAEKKAKGNDKDALEEVAKLKQIQQWLATGVPLRRHPEKDLIPFAARRGVLTAKPVLYVANVSEEEAANADSNPYVTAVRKYADEEGAVVVPVSAKIESELSQMSPEEKREFLKEFGLDMSGLERMILAGYKLLGLMTYFTAGEKEVRAWTIPSNTTAQKAAGKIHSDFERGFIAAETVAFQPFIDAGGWSGAKSKGWMRQEGREYAMVDGDVVLFRFNV